MDKSRAGEFSVYQRGECPSPVWIVIPAYNEAEVIGEVLGFLCRTGYTVVVVDDGSKDRTLGLSAEFPIHILHHDVNIGTGAALQSGFRYALEQDAQYIVTFDADGQHNPADIPRLLKPLEMGQFDVALGSRFLESDTCLSVPFFRRLVLRAAVFFTRQVSKIDVSDTHNGIRAFSREALQKIELTQMRMAHASEILSLIARHKLAYIEIPVTITYTEYSQRKGQGVIVKTLRIVWDLLKVKIGP